MQAKKTKGKNVGLSKSVTKPPKAIPSHYEYKIQKIGIGPFSLNLPDEDQLENKVNYEIKTSIRFSEPENHLIVLLFNLRILNKETGYLFGTLNVHVNYEVVNWDEVITSKGDTFQIPQELLVTFASIGVSTLRGIAYAKFEGTYLRNYFMPVINPSSLVQNPTKVSG